MGEAAGAGCAIPERIGTEGGGSGDAGGTVCVGGMPGGGVAERDGSEDGTATLATARGGSAGTKGGTTDAGEAASSFAGAALRVSLKCATDFLSSFSSRSARLSVSTIRENRSSL